MVADFSPSRRLRRLVTVTAALVVVASALTTPTTIHAAPLDGIELAIAAETPTYTPGEAADLTINIANRSGSPLEIGEVQVHLDPEPITSENDLDVWLSDDTAALPTGELVAEARSPALMSGGTNVLDLSISEDTPGLPTQPGVHRMSVSMHVSGETVADARGLLVSVGDESFEPTVTPLVLAMPITVPPQAEGLIGVEDLAAWTTPAGLLSRQLDPIYGRPVAIGIDPMIIASVRVLGDRAPDSAVAWLDRLASAPNEIFPLAYADADLALQAQADFTAPLDPTSFADILDPESFGPPPDLDSTDQGADGRATPDEPSDSATQPSVPPGEIPTTEAVLDWRYTRTDLAWPPPRTISNSDFAFFSAAGLTTTIVSSGDLQPAPASASVIVNQHTTLVADHGISAALRDGTTARNTLDGDAAAAALAARLAIRDHRAGEALPVFAVFDRGAPTSPGLVAGLLETLADLPWYAPASLTDAIGAPPVESALDEGTEPDDRIAAAQRLSRAEVSVEAFATVLEDHRLLTAPQRRATLGLLSIGWQSDPGAWREALSAHELQTRELLDAISVVPSSVVNVLASQTEVPITIENTLEYPVNLIVDVDPSNGRLIVDRRIEAIVGPQSRATALIPVQARIGNGDVILSVKLHSPTGEPIGSEVRIPANVQADWEGLGALIIAGIAIVLFGLGLWRNIRRRRRERAEKENESGQEAPNAGTETSRPLTSPDGRDG